MNIINWNLQLIQKEALNYQTRSNFKSGNYKAYTAAQKRGILDVVCSHMIVKYQIWNFDIAKTEALKYNTKKDFKKNNSAAYSYAEKNSILDDVCEHMVTLRRDKYTNKEIFEIAKKYNTKKDFIKNDHGCYLVAHKRKMLDQVCGHMEVLWQKKWNLETLKQESLKYKTRSEFRRFNSGAYSACLDLGILEDICSHMIKSQSSSWIELEVKSIVTKHFPNSKKIIKRNIQIPDKPFIKAFELDIFIPELNKGIEVDGTYWHSFKGLRNHPRKLKWSDDDITNYHNIKDSYFKSIGVDVIHITEEEIEKNIESVKTKIYNFLGVI